MSANAQTSYTYDGNYTFDKDELKNLRTCWKKEGEPRGKSGKSGEGGRGRDWNRIMRGGSGGGGGGGGGGRGTE